MIERLGKRAVALPLLAVFLVSLVFGTAFAPIMRAEMRDVPIAVASLDEGAATPAGEVNAGAEAAKKMAQKMGATGVFKVTSLESQEEVDAALANNDVYAALVFPKDFTARQVAKQMATAGAAAGQAAGAPGQAASAPGAEAAAGAQAAPGSAADAAAGTQGEAESDVVLYINIGKNQMLATQLAQALPVQLQQAGLSAEVVQVNTADLGGGLMAPMFAIQGMVMPCFIMTMLGSVLLFLVLAPGRSGREARQAVAIQAGYAVAASALAAALAYAIAAWIGGMSLPFAPVFLTLWIGSLCTMLLFVGALDAAFPLGVLVILLTFALGTVTAMLAPEMMPAFWSAWVTPWAPQFQIGTGMREILFMDSGLWTSRMPVLLIEGAIGLLLLAVAGLRGARGADAEAASGESGAAAAA